MLNTIHLTHHEGTLRGLRAMLSDAWSLDSGEVETLSWALESTEIDIPTALYVVEIAKRAPDEPDFFPHGKWNTIQTIQHHLERELDKLFRHDT